MIYKKLYANYKFVVAMEHKNKPGYITEKIINAYEANAIPIYSGDTDTVSELFNPKSYINLNLFKNYKEASEYILNISNNNVIQQEILSEPILTNRGKIFFEINKENLSSEAEAFLNEIAIEIRKKYINKINDRKFF